MEPIGRLDALLALRSSGTLEEDHVIAILSGGEAHPPVADAVPQHKGSSASDRGGENLPKGAPWLIPFV